MEKSDTIAAVATPAGTGGVAVIRISGSGALAVLRRVFPRDQYAHGQMYYGSVKRTGELLDRVLAVFFHAPHSYTGEDTAELHCHGSAVGVKNILRFVLESGARPAGPGEFTRRAFLNGKMDLSQAEAVGDFIAASSDAAARASLKQMEGSLKKAILEFQDSLTDLLARVEAGVEYPEEDLEQEITEDALPMIAALHQKIDTLAGTFDQGRILKEGLDVAIAGKPNAGKSSLMNALLGVDRAIVADLPGTTRDTIEQSFLIDEIRINLTDTAGIRNTEDLIESEGVKRSKIAVSGSKLTIFLLDTVAGITQEDHLVYEALLDAEVDILVVLNKLDASERPSEEALKERFPALGFLEISAKTGFGLDSLRQWLYEYAAANEASAESLLITNLRHRYALEKAARQLKDAADALKEGMDLDCVTIDLRGAWMSLGEITGNTVSEEIIDRVFEKFCLGK